MNILLYIALLGASFVVQGFSMNVIDRIYPGRVQKYNINPLNSAIFDDTRQLNVVLTSRPSNEPARPDEKKRIFKAIMANKIIHGENMELSDGIQPHLAGKSLAAKSITNHFSIIQLVEKISKELTLAGIADLLNEARYSNTLGNFLKNEDKVTYKEEILELTKLSGISPAQFIDWFTEAKRDHQAGLSIIKPGAGELDETPADEMRALESDVILKKKTASRPVDELADELLIQRVPIDRRDATRQDITQAIDGCAVEDREEIVLLVKQLSRYNVDTKQIAEHITNSTIVQLIDAVRQIPSTERYVHVARALLMSRELLNGQEIDVILRILPLRIDQEFPVQELRGKARPDILAAVQQPALHQDGEDVHDKDNITNNFIRELRLQWDPSVADLQRELAEFWTAVQALPETRDDPDDTLKQGEVRKKRQIFYKARVKESLVWWENHWDNHDAFPKNNVRLVLHGESAGLQEVTRQEMMARLWHFIKEFCKSPEGRAEKATLHHLQGALMNAIAQALVNGSNICDSGKFRYIAELLLSGRLKKTDGKVFQMFDNLKDVAIMPAAEKQFIFNVKDVAPQLRDFINSLSQKAQNGPRTANAFFMEFFNYLKDKENDANIKLDPAAAVFSIFMLKYGSVKNVHHKQEYTLIFESNPDTSFMNTYGVNVARRPYTDSFGIDDYQRYFNAQDVYELAGPNNEAMFWGDPLRGAAVTEKARVQNEAWREPQVMVREMLAAQNFQGVPIGHEFNGNARVPQKEQERRFPNSKEQLYERFKELEDQRGIDIMIEHGVPFEHEFYDNPRQALGWY
ncbi:MAG: hypothetical protein V4482_06775 [Pseudomonadota bacterium]